MPAADIMKTHNRWRSAATAAVAEADSAQASRVYRSETQFAIAAQVMILK